MKKKKKKDYPEHDKMMEIAHLSQAIGEFLEWAGQEKGLRLSTWDQWVVAQAPYTKLLAEHFGIDLDKIEDEKRAMLAKYTDPH